jgi:hypothetical protein
MNLTCSVCHQCAPTATLLPLQHSSEEILARLRAETEARKDAAARASGAHTSATTASSQEAEYLGQYGVPGEDGGYGPGNNGYSYAPYGE